MAKKAKADGFEQSLIKLEKIVEQMESGDASLDETVKLYEEGIALSLACSKLLKETEQKVSVLKETAAGHFVQEALFEQEEQEAVDYNDDSGQEE